MKNPSLLFLLLFFIPFSVIGMVGKEEKLSLIDAYDQFKATAIHLLTKEQQLAINPDFYKTNREQGVNALIAFSQHLIGLAYRHKFLMELSEEKLKEESNPLAQHLIEQYDISTGLKTIKIFDEVTAKKYAISLLTEKEKKSLQKNEYRKNREKADATLTHFAQLTLEALAKNNLIEVSPEEFRKNFIKERRKELDALWLPKEL